MVVKKNYRFFVVEYNHVCDIFLDLSTKPPRKLGFVYEGSLDWCFAQAEKFVARGMGGDCHFSEGERLTLSDVTSKYGSRLVFMLRPYGGTNPRKQDGRPRIYWGDRKKHYWSKYSDVGIKNYPPY